MALGYQTLGWALWKFRGKRELQGPAQVYYGFSLPKAQAAVRRWQSYATPGWSHWARIEEVDIPTDAEGPPVRRVVMWPDPVTKAKWLDAGASLDAMHPMIVALAGRLVRGRSPAEAARLIFRSVRDRIAYARDMRRVGGRWQRGEEFSDAPTTLARGYEDCDGKARLFVALGRAARAAHSVPLQARIVPVFRGEHFTHVQAQVRYPGSAREPLAMPGGWLLAELTCRGVELGRGTEACARTPEGVVLAGPPPPAWRSARS